MRSEAGATPLRLTASPGTDELPVYSPDGLAIVFASRRDGAADIFSMLHDGSLQTNVSNEANADDSSPTVRPSAN